MDCNRSNIYHQERRISKALKIGWVQRASEHNTGIISAPRNIDSELAFLLPLMAGSAKLKIQIFVVEKDTEDLIGEIIFLAFFSFIFLVPSKLAEDQVPGSEVFCHDEARGNCQAQRRQQQRGEREGDAGLHIRVGY